MKFLSTLKLLALFFSFCIYSIAQTNTPSCDSTHNFGIGATNFSTVFGLVMPANFSKVTFNQKIVDIRIIINPGTNESAAIPIQKKFGIYCFKVPKGHSFDLTFLSDGHKKVQKSFVSSNELTPIEDVFLSPNSQLSSTENQLNLDNIISELKPLRQDNFNQFINWAKSIDADLNVRKVAIDSLVFYVLKNKSYLSNAEKTLKFISTNNQDSGESVKEYAKKSLVLITILKKF